jgi:di/tricarboxylate transporter
LRNKIEVMQLRFTLPAFVIGAGLLLPVQTPALAKTSYKPQKIKKYKARKFKAGKKFKVHKVKHKAAKH